MPESVDKARRQRAIEALVRGQAIASQQDLSRALRRQGIRVTQATLSRDLKDLRMLRVPGDGGYRYQPAGEEVDAGSAPETRRLRTVAALEVTGVEANEHCVVVRTLTGRAQGVAVWLDDLGLPDALATLAGDDTVLVLPRSVRRTDRLRRCVVEALGHE